jgi:hypothetical protein
MKLPIFIFLLFIKFIFGQPPNVEHQNGHEFEVKIEKGWNEQQEYKYLFDNVKFA